VLSFVYAKYHFWQVSLCLVSFCAECHYVEVHLCIICAERSDVECHLCWLLLCWVSFMLSVIMLRFIYVSYVLNVVMLSVVMLSIIYYKCHYVECRFCCVSLCWYLFMYHMCWASLCWVTLCWVSFMLSFMFSVIMLRFIHVICAERRYVESYYVECHLCWVLCWVLYSVLCSVSLCRVSFKRSVVPPPSIQWWKMEDISVSKMASQLMHFFNRSLVPLSVYLFLRLSICLCVCFSLSIVKTFFAIPTFLFS